MIRILKCALYLMLILILFSGCAGQDDTITFSAEIETVSENSILVRTLEFSDFDKASVDLREAEYDFEPAVGQLVEIVIRPEIRESYPVQVTAVKLIYKGEAKRTISDYFPIKENLRYVYEGQGNEFAGYDVYADYVSGNSIQQRVDNGGTVMAKVYEINEGKLTLTLSKGEVYYRENMLGKTDGTEEVILMEPLEKGTSWALKDGRTKTITSMSTEVETPTGTFTAMEVITEGGDSTVVDYYSRDIGLVKTIFQSGGMEVRSSLQSIEEAKGRDETLRFYYPDYQADRIYYSEKEVTWHTNDDTAKILEQTYKEKVNEVLGTVFSTDTAIRSLSLDEENKVRLDLNSAFADDMNAGSAYEMMILQCAANTFGNYYNSGQVVLTVEGKPYESGHILMGEDEVIPVKLEGITEKN